MIRNEFAQLARRLDVVDPLVGSVHIDEFDQLWTLPTMNIPNHSQQFSRHREHWTAFNEIWAWSKQTHELAFDSPPVMHPERMIHQNNRVCRFESALNRLPGCKSIDDPRVEPEQFVMAAIEFVLGSWFPARIPL